MINYITQSYVRNSRRNSVIVELIDAVTGAQVTGKVAADMTISIGKWRQGLDTVTVQPGALPSWVPSGFTELSATRLPGLYKLDIPNSAFVNDGTSDTILVAVLCTGSKPVYLMLPLTDMDTSISSIGRG